MSGPSSHLDHLRLRQLRLLDLIDRHRSLRAVGEALNLTQPAVSQMLKDLEFAFGAALVDRSVRGAVLTPLGRVALQRARAGLAIFDNLAADLGTESPAVVRVGSNPASLFKLMPAALRQLEAQRAGIRFLLQAGTVGNMMSRLLDGDLDCYVGRVDWTAMPVPTADLLVYEPLTETGLVVVCSADHPLAGRAEVSAAELAQWPWALPSEDTNNRRSIEVAFRNCGVPAPLPVVEVSADPTSLLMLAQEVDLLTFVPRAVLNPQPVGKRIVTLSTPDLSLPPIRICFVTLREIGSLPSVQRLRDALLQVCRQGGDAIA
ncbi:LysR family transcriptional regulator [Chachezhania sediminis]|uniref:LysR family transcriptional regulator n=1 Tax=Chachezhania sediminis TaxID=2599291 RepID=UPI00131CAB44|nr:LysR family transcriptional regulator [Chachezhania sediminis]